MNPLPPRESLEKLVILNKHQEYQPFTFNAVQADLYPKLTGHDIVIKARQQGISTLAQAIIYGQITTQPGYMALTRAQHFTGINLFRRRFETFQNHAPKNAPHVYSWDKYTYRFPQLESAYHIRMRPPFGSTINIAHLSELAYWDERDWETDFRDVAYRSERVLIESTSNPYNPRWFWLCVNALLGKNDYCVHFYEWWWSPEYRLPYKGEQYVFTDEEQVLIEEHNLTLEQIKWRRRKIEELGPVRFQFEYPESLDGVLGLK